VVKILVNVLKKLDANMKSDEISNYIEIPPSSDLGDFAFPCFFLAGKLKRSPEQIALEIREEIGDSFKKTMFDEITTSGPYVNFYVNRKEMVMNILREIQSKGEKYGAVNIGKGKKAVIEHTSINPNASPHVGRARNAIIGDSIVKILEYVNFKPEVHYYVNDVSKQIAMLVVAKAENKKFSEMLKLYVDISKKMQKDPQIEQQAFFWLRRFEAGDKPAVTKFKKITATCLKGQKEILADLGIHYDLFDYESDYLKKARKILEQLKTTKRLHQDKDGRWYVDQSNTPILKKMKFPALVLTRSDDTGLYPLRDLAYNIDKLKIAQRNIVVLGEDQKLYQMQIGEVLKLLNSKSPEVVHYSFILLSHNGKHKKMATRKGEVVLLEDFLEDVTKKAEREIKKRKTKGDPRVVGIAAVKYKILKNSPNKIINFNLDEALQFEGDTGPYLLYSYARANSILKKSKKKPSVSVTELDDKEIALIKKIGEYPQIISKAYKDLNPSIIASYSYSLAQSFNEFYHACPVIGEKNEMFRISVVKSFKIILKTSLALLGIKTLEVM